MGKNQGLKRPQTVALERLEELVRKLFAGYARGPNEDEYEAYIEGLRQFTEGQLIAAIAKARAEANENNPGFVPSVDQIKEFIEFGHSVREAKDDCELCRGTGYKIIERHNGRVAVRCDCRNP
jgi:hypothetical protein